jgi:DNA polymerase I-like protein with 3'-5' exonuclease and polymerase domains
MQASPFWDDNLVVSAGYLHGDGERTAYHDSYMPEELVVPDDGVLMVGQNIKFDLLWYCRYKGGTEFLSDVDIWDTQLAEYILTGQESRMISLDRLAEKYGLPTKDDRIKEYWKAGIDTTDIPKTELLDYMRQDVENTEQVFLKQVQETHDLGIMNLMMSQMQALKCTIVMEYNGMYIDAAQLEREREELQHTCADLEAKLNSMTDSYPIKINHSSNDHVSVVLFGGEITVKEPKEILDDEGNPVVYKSGMKKGKVKTRITDVKYELWKHTDWHRYTERAQKVGFYKVDKKVLSKIRDDEIGFAATYCGTLLEYREATKQLGTYIEGFMNLQFPDGRIHGNLIHTNTRTGRLSSSKPNMQNLTS